MRPPRGRNCPAMDLFELIARGDSGPASAIFSILQAELKEAVRLYWSLASDILLDSGIRLLDPPPEIFGLKRNFFSALFLYSYHRAGIGEERRITYAAINHCLRGMVTGCDNLLDDEYKATLTTDLPADGVRFRSVLDIMVSDRVLFAILLRACGDRSVSPDRVQAASAATLRALTRSGAQEAEEEGGVREILSPREVLDTVHHFKTGLLFQCPWAVPRLVEGLEAERVQPLLDALYSIGIGCQIMDDLVDFERDLSMRRHNYLVSLIHHGTDQAERHRLDRTSGVEPVHVADFPIACAAAGTAVEWNLATGLEALLPSEFHGFVRPMMVTLARLIGAAPYLEFASREA